MKKILIFIIAILSIVCLFAFSASAAEPDTNGESVTLSDGTVCYLWDTENDALIWYISATEDGVNTYSYIKATSSSIEYNCGWKGDTSIGVYQYQLGNTLNITDENGKTYGASTIVVANLMDDIKITSGQNVGNLINSFTQTFEYSTNIQYVYLPLATVAVNAKTFLNCSNLKYCNLMDLTELRQINTQAFSGCTSLFAGVALDLSNTKLMNIYQGALNNIATTSITLPSTIKTIGEWVFQNCKQATSIDFKGVPTTINMNSTFKDCTKLKSITGLGPFFESGNISSIGKYFLYGCRAIEQVDGLIENGILVVPEGVKTVDQFAFSYCGMVKYIDLPSTLTTINQQGFSYMTNVKLVDFGKITGNLTLGNCGHFRDLDSLVAVSLPEGMTEINNRAFASCDNLTAFYMPNSIQKLSSNGNDQGSFCNSTKLYFVEESFTVSQCLINGEVDTSKLVLPEKPDIYYMPTSLQTFTGHIYSNDTWCNATIFRNCKSLNSVLVFPEGFTSMVTMRAFDNMGTKDSPKTLVFTGNIQSFVISHQSTYVSFVFANANDESFDDLGILRTTKNSNTSQSYAYFCSTGKKYDLNAGDRVASGQDPTTEENITNIAKTIEALNLTETDGTLHVGNVKNVVVVKPECEIEGSKICNCFCGVEVSREAIDALGHDYKEENRVYTFGSIYAEATSCMTCTRECGINSETVNEGYVISDYGYSSCEYNSKVGVSRSFNVNKELLAEFEKVNGGVEIGFGITPQKENEVPNTLDDFAVSAALKKAEDESIYSTISFIVTYGSDEYKDALIYIAGYVRVNDGEIDFIDDTFEAISYNSILAKENEKAQ